MDNSRAPDIAGLKRIAGLAAMRYEIPTTLVQAVCAHESRWYPFASRYEPGFFNRYIAGRKWPTFWVTSQPTEQRDRATSWGLMQIMGQVARERGCPVWSLAELCDPEVGVEWGVRQLAYLRERYFDPWGWHGVLRAYNTGRPQVTEAGAAYLAHVLKAGEGL